MYRDVLRCETLLNHALQIRGLDVGQGYIRPMQKGQSIVIVLEVERTTHTWWHLMQKTEHALVVAAAQAHLIKIKAEGLPLVTLHLYFISLILALDLGLFNRKAHKVGFKEALGWSTLWFMVAMAFAYFALPELYTGEKEAAEKRMEFITGYILELSLSMDNVFVIALIFTYFKVKPEFQHRVLEHHGTG